MEIASPGLMQFYAMSANDKSHVHLMLSYKMFCKLFGRDAHACLMNIALPVNAAPAYSIHTNTE